jgi:lambda family phage minor tail protein L
MSTTVWSASASLSLNTIVAPTESRRVAGLLFKVVVAGTTGSSEPNWPTTINQRVYDNDVEYISFKAVFSELQNITPSSVIELFELKLNQDLHGTNETRYFHNGSSLNLNGEIKWNGNFYQRFPIQVEGFEFKGGQLPRPTLTISNATGLISALLLGINEITPGNDLLGAIFTRRRTNAKFLPHDNFVGNNPFGTPDETVEDAKQIFTIARKSTENREIVQFELASALDMANVRCPNRICTRKEFPSIGTFT